MRGIIRELGETGAEGADVTVFDLEAGLEHLKRGTPTHMDALVAVAEPYFRSLETATRVVELARELGIPNVVAVANKVRNAGDEAAVARVLEAHGVPIVAVVPFDQAVLDADRLPAALFDTGPDSPAVRAVEGLADRLGQMRGAHTDT